MAAWKDREAAAARADVLIDPAFVPVAQSTADAIWNLEHLEEIRAPGRLVPEGFELADDVLCIDQHVPGRDGDPDVRLLHLAPAEVRGPLPAVLHVHGGGYLIGSPEAALPRLQRVVQQIGCVAFSLDYRLAPEAPAPAAVRDCLTVLRWMHGQAAALEIDPARFAIWGDSAGGGIAACTAQAARDEGGLPLVAQFLMQPMLDDRTVLRAEAVPSLFGTHVWTPERNRFGWRSYLGVEPGSDNVPPYAAAARATDLRGLPPAFLTIGALDLFLEETLDYGRRLAEVGVDMEMHVYPGTVHGFESAPEAGVTLKHRGLFDSALRRAFGLTE
jgi:triacylglycerol lipase